MLIEITSMQLLELPSELLFQIYLRLDNLDAVWALMCTSQRLWTAFHLHPVLVVEAVITNGLPCQVVSVIKTVWNFRSSHPKAMTLGEMRYIDEDLGNESLNPNVSAEFVRSFIALSRKVHGIAHVVLDDCLVNLRAIHRKLCPFPTLFPEIPQNEYPPRVDPRPFLCPPDWGEEMRLIQGLWMCDFHNLLMQALQKDDPAWVSIELGELESAAELILEFFFGNGWSGTFWTISHGLAIMEFPPEQRAAPYCEATMLPDTIDLTVPLRAGGLEMAARCGMETFTVHPLKKERRLYDHLLGDMNPETDGYQFLIADNTAIAPMASDIHRLPVCEYAHLGLMHWSSDRMRGLGFIYKNDPRIFRIWQTRVYDYWLSILPDGLVKRWTSIQLGEKLEQRMFGNCAEERSG